MKRILIGHDDEVVRSGLRAIIESRPDWTVSGEAVNGKDALAQTLETKPDVAIFDYSMPFMTGAEVSRRIKSSHLRTEVLILTMHESEALLAEVLMAGVRAFCSSQTQGAILSRPSRRCLNIARTLPAWYWKNFSRIINSARGTSRPSNYPHGNRTSFNLSRKGTPTDP